MVFLTIIIIITFIIVILLFASPRLSPIPYFPTNKYDLPLIIKALNLKNNQTIVDLGAGTGTVIFEASKEAKKKKLNTKFIAVELNPILILILCIKKVFHPNRKNIKVIHADIFKFKINSSTREPRFNWGQPVNSLTIYLYVSPWHMEKVIRNLKLRTKSFSIVSYFYPLPKETNTYQVSCIRGKNKIFVYDMIKV